MEVTIEREDVFDRALVGEDAGRVVYERELLVVVVRLTEDAVDGLAEVLVHV